MKMWRRPAQPPVGPATQQARLRRASGPTAGGCQCHHLLACPYGTDAIGHSHPSNSAHPWQKTGHCVILYGSQPGLWPCLVPLHLQGRSQCPRHHWQQSKPQGQLPLNKVLIKCWTIGKPGSRIICCRQLVKFSNNNHHRNQQQNSSA